MRVSPSLNDAVLGRLREMAAPANLPPRAGMSLPTRPVARNETQYPQFIEPIRGQDN